MSEGLLSRFHQAAGRAPPFSARAAPPGGLPKHEPSAGKLGAQNGCELRARAQGDGPSRGRKVCVIAIHLNMVEIKTRCMFVLGREIGHAATEKSADIVSLPT
jgi:hypothetical protein